MQPRAGGCSHTRPRGGRLRALSVLEANLLDSKQEAKLPGNEGNGKGIGLGGVWGGG